MKRHAPQKSVLVRRKRAHHKTPEKLLVRQAQVFGGLVLRRVRDKNRIVEVLHNRKKEKHELPVRRCTRAAALMLQPLILSHLQH